MGVRSENTEEYKQVKTNFSPPASKATNSCSSNWLSCGISTSAFSDQHELKDHLIKEFEIPAELLTFLSIDLGLDPNQSFQPSQEIRNRVDPVKCPKCHKEFQGMKGMNQHYSKKHLRCKKQHYCEICGKRFKHRHGLRFHIRQVHQQATRVSCPVCSQPIYNKYMLPKHMKKFHSELI